MKLSGPRRLVRILACLAILIPCFGVLSQPAQAQSNSFKDIMGRGLGTIFGSGEDEGKGPKVYASPSANELVPNAADVGVPQIKSLRVYDPIALPDQPAPPGMSALDLPNLPAYAPQLNLETDAFRPNARLVLEARLSEDGEAVPNGLVWRLFSAVPQIDGGSSLIATSREAEPSFDVPPGPYIVHATFGRAGIVKRIDFTGVSAKESIILKAGGLKLEATVSDKGPNAPASHLKFDVFTDDESGSDRELIASGVSPGEILRLNAGLYHIVSTYGSVNARTEADVKVEPGKLTEATLQHRASEQTLKLVREEGGEAIADTAWTVTSMSGDILRKSAGAYASMVLAEGEYLAVARNRDTTYQRAFTVTAGQDADVEIMLSDLAEQEVGG